MRVVSRSRRTILNQYEKKKNEIYSVEFCIFKKALEKVEEAMRSEKTLTRYREEQNMNESDMNLSGFVNQQFHKIQFQQFSSA